jgi:hypothetical protein
MRKLLLASSACFVLVGGLAVARTTTINTHLGPTITNTSIPVKNAGASNGSASATSGGVAVTAKLNDVANTTASDNTFDSNNPTKTLTNVGNSYLSVERTDTNLRVTYATSSTNGSVHSTLTVTPVTTEAHNVNNSVSTGNALMFGANGGDGINTAQQNTGVQSLQQNSVSLGSQVQGGTGFSGF